MVDLLDNTFIIPINIEHPSRLRNARSVLGYINHHFKTNVIIYQTLKPGQEELGFMGDLKNIRITHIIEEVSESTPFHKTLYLSRMLDHVTTKCFCIYDIDIVLHIDAYVKCVNDIISDSCDMSIPFPYDEEMQIKVDENFDRSEFDKDYLLSGILESGLYFNEVARYGHCVFLNSETYRKTGGENVDFISWGPEDEERIIRYEKLGKRIIRNNHLVFHFEHYRTDDSGEENPHFIKNVLIYENIRRMKKKELIEYYKIN
jgi:hypothetical protein